MVQAREGPSRDRRGSPATHKRKREQVISACERCRRNKIKVPVADHLTAVWVTADSVAQCDRNRPCAACIRGGVECINLAQENEMQHQAIRRKHEEVSDSRDSLLSIVQALAGQDESHAAEVYRRLRAGHSFTAVSEHARLGSVRQPLVDAHERILRQDFSSRLLSPQ